MWVWSDELVDRVMGEGFGSSDRIPLVAYAVSPEADLDELAIELLADTGQRAPALQPTDGRTGNR